MLLTAEAKDKCLLRCLGKQFPQYCVIALDVLATVDPVVNSEKLPVISATREGTAVSLSCKKDSGFWWFPPSEFST